MAIKIGNNNIAAIFKGNVEIKEIYRGNELVFVSGTEAPTISFVSAEQTTVTISVLNNDPETLTFVRITHGSTTQDFNVSIASGVSGNVTVTNLDVDTSFNFIANVDADGKGLSEDSNTLTASTLAVQLPTFSNISTTQTSITFRVNNPNSISGTVFYARDADPNTGSASAAIDANGQTGNLSFTSLNWNQTFSIRARLQLAGVLYGVASQNITTTSILQPNHSLVSRTQTNVTVRQSNPNTFTATCYYAWNTNPTTSSANQSIGAGANGANISRSYTPGQSQSFRSFARAGNGITTVNSSTRSTNFSSLANQTPTITRGSITASSVQFTLRNNNSVTAQIRYHVVTNFSNPTTSSPSTGNLGAGATSGTITVTGLSANTTHRIRASADINGNLSGVANNQFNTLQIKSVYGGAERTFNTGIYRWNAENLELIGSTGGSGWQSLAQDANFVYGASTVFASNTIARVAKSNFALETNFFQGTFSNTQTDTSSSLAVAGTNLFILQGSTLQRYSTQTGQFLGSFTSGNGEILSVAADSTHVYFGTDQGRVVKLTHALSFVLLSVEVTDGGSFGPYPRVLTLSERGNFIYTGGQNQRARRLDKATLNIVTSASAYSSFFSAQVSTIFDDGNYVLISLLRNDNNIQILNSNDFSQISSFTSSTGASNSNHNVTSNNLNIFVTSGNPANFSQHVLRKYNYTTFAFEQEVNTVTAGSGGGLRVRPIVD